MKKNYYASKCDPRINARIMRVIEEIVCKHRNNLPDGWRAVVKFQTEGKEVPYYYLDLVSNQGGGNFAPVKMQMLELFPGLKMSGTASLPMITDTLAETDIPNHYFEYLLGKHDISDLSESDWGTLKEYGITHWQGGIRIPYDILITDKDVVQELGEIRIAFSGAKEWMDVYFALQIFKGIQVILGELWENSQIWYNLRGLQGETISGFWLTEMKISEAPLLW